MGSIKLQSYGAIVNLFLNLFGRVLPVHARFTDVDNSVSLGCVVAAGTRQVVTAQPPEQRGEPLSWLKCSGGTERERTPSWRRGRCYDGAAGFAESVGAVQRHRGHALRAERLSKTPKYILLENVKGFETSVASDKLIQTLESCRYTYQAFLLSPTLLGVPNSRLRYFLLAKLQPDTFCFQTSHQILKHFPDHDDADLRSRDGSSFNQMLSTDSNKKEQNKSEYCAENGKSQVNLLYKLETSEHQKQKQIQDNNLSIQLIQDFLEEGLQNPSLYFIPPKSLLRYALILDIVGQTCRRSVCFTKGYGHYVEGTGSVLKTASDVELSEVFQSFQALSEDEKLNQLSKLKLRYFTPREIANLHGFPSEFSFPEKTSLRQRYRLLGNSLNIHVVAKLIRLMVE
ncbi:tRNA (cytosine(38)-C(5))-methyltransferase isoform X3 [Scyliorhinus torazame]|uniref:tRNA (cytosine(38)-C(5))-methyltransferase isoform X3 n=1 Tax=Scyliorhinus torazame TaxID=75743 RepID=UPI003B5BA77F